MASTRTVHITADTSEAEASLERCVALAERFRKAWGDMPVPQGIERLAIRPGDVLVLRYDKALSHAEVIAVKDAAEHAIPEVSVVVLSGGVGVETVLGAS